MTANSEAPKARRCVFCGARRALTIEHAWPEWIVERWGRGDYHHVHRTEAGAFREYSAPNLAVRVRRVCKVCNHGWMSDLENKSKRLLIWLMELRSLHLSTEDQNLVALWATKTAMMLGFTHPTRRSIADADYHHLYEHQQPPPFTHVWIARYGGSEPDPFYRHHGLQFDSPSGRRGTGYGATMCLEHLVLRVFGHDLGEELELAHHPQVARAQRVIRPATGGCSWPPSGAMDAAGLLAYADAFLSPS